MDYPKTGKEARKIGATKYFTGLKCKFDHISARYAHNGQCVDCGKIAGRNARNTPEGKIYEKEYYKKIRTERVEQIMLNSAKGRARKRNLPCSITQEDIIAIWPIDGLCPILGIELKHKYDGTHGSAFNSPSLDCIIPSLGYISGNIAIISQKANMLKGNEIDPIIFRKIADWLERNKG
jgi:hypothetical protein